MSDEKLDLLLEKMTRVETMLRPDPGQPSLLTQHAIRIEELDEKIDDTAKELSVRIDDLNKWKNRLIGAWGIVTTFISIHVIGKHGG